MPCAHLHATVMPMCSPTCFGHAMCSCACCGTAHDLCFMLRWCHVLMCMLHAVAMPCVHVHAMAMPMRFASCYGHVTCSCACHVHAHVLCFMLWPCHVLMCMLWRCSCVLSFMLWSCHAPTCMLGATWPRQPLRQPARGFNPPRSTHGNAAVTSTSVPHTLPPAPEPTAAVEPVPSPTLERMSLHSHAMLCSHDWTPYRQVMRRPDHRRDRPSATDRSRSGGLPSAAEPFKTAAELTAEFERRNLLAAPDAEASTRRPVRAEATRAVIEPRGTASTHPTSSTLVGANAGLWHLCVLSG